VIFPTRDDDVVFLDQFRRELEKRFTLTIPESVVVDDCLDKWRTYRAARSAGVPVPQSWLVETKDELRQISKTVRFPCVLKPPASRRWHQGASWQLVGARKAIGIASRDELIAQYEQVAQADKRALVQEMVLGGDECLVITACYFDRHSNFVVGFNTQKTLQIPERFGTGCIVRSADYPELFAPTIRLLQQISFTGIAEVEYKWDAAEGAHKLIEINPRPWDQHRLGQTQGVDLIWLAYCEHAGLPEPRFQKKHEVTNWIAEDAVFLGAARSLYHRDGKLRSLLRMAKGKKIFAIWSWKDPLPLIGYMTTRFLPGLMWAALRAVGSKWLHRRKRATRTQEVG
jgi:predicted ATP-grasp superfamily ATP-dependent carboligase